VITVIGNWEQGFSEYDQSIEYRIWKQTIAAFEVDRWLMVGFGPDRVTSFESYLTMEEALATVGGSFYFMRHTVTTRIEDVEFSGDVNLVFGSPDENLSTFVRPEDTEVLLPTPKKIDMYAAACLPWALNYVVN
jgi:hypothetical protein